MAWLRNQQNKGDGLKLLYSLAEESVTLVVLDPQYRALLDKQSYGNEGKGRGRKQASLPAQSEVEIADMLERISCVLVPFGHLALWIDKYMLVEGIAVSACVTAGLTPVDLITWDKGRMGMGYRTRRQSEYVLICQKPPIKAKGHWHNHGIPDVWTEKVSRQGHPHRKPLELTKSLIGTMTLPGDLVVDPCAGSYTTLEACEETGRQFLGCDLLG